MNSNFGHNALHLILKLLALVRKGKKPRLENGLNEHLIPGHPLFLINLQTFGQKVNGVRTEVFPLDFQMPVLNVVDELESPPGSPRSFAMQHLIEDHAQCPHIALRTVIDRFEDLDCHVKWSPHALIHLISEIYLEQQILPCLITPPRKRMLAGFRSLFSVSYKVNLHEPMVFGLPCFIYKCNIINLYKE